MSEAARIFRAAREVLTDKEYESWELYYRAGWSYGKIALNIGCDRSTVQRRVQRALKKVHDKLEEAA